MIGERPEYLKSARLVKVHRSEIWQNLPSVDECDPGVEIRHHPRAGADPDGRRWTFHANGMKSGGDVLGSETFLSIFISWVHVNGVRSRFHRDSRLLRLLGRIDRDGRMLLSRSLSVDGCFEEHDRGTGRTSEYSAVPGRYKVDKKSCADTYLGVLAGCARSFLVVKSSISSDVLL